MPTYLADIAAAHRVLAHVDERDLDALIDQASKSPLSLDFAAKLENAVADGSDLAVIAEIKRRSPSRGDLRANLDPGQLASQYARGGAACLSVLTDWEHFGGSPSDLGAAKEACSLPVLRKDFTVSTADICDARLMGADAVLLIAAILSDEELVRHLSLAQQLGLTAIVEVHDEGELDRVRTLQAPIIGVNQRDLATFAVDTERAVRLVEKLPSGVLLIAESGISSAEDARRLCDAGYNAVLVGESLVRSTDPAGQVFSLAHCRNERPER